MSPTPATPDTPASVGPTDALDFAPAPLRERQDGWTADRQRAFVTAIADSGCISQACRVVGVSPQSAYRLRHHPKGKAFAIAWDAALRCASARLVDIAMERAIHGSRRQYWRAGELVGESIIPSDSLLIFLLSRLDTNRFGTQVDRHPALPDRAGTAARVMPKLLETLYDIDAPVDPAAMALTNPVVPDDGRGRVGRRVGRRTGGRARGPAGGPGAARG